MGWKGFSRSLAWATVTELERQARRKQRERARQQRELVKMQEKKRNAHEVEIYESRVEAIRSVHKGCGGSWNWEEIRSSEPPTKPVNERKNEIEAKKALNDYTPTLFQRLFGRIEKKRAMLEKGLVQARELDKVEYQKSVEEYCQNLREWRRQKEMASRVIEGDPEAYLEVIRKINPFKEIEQLGLTVKYEVVNRKLIASNLQIPNKDFLTTEKKILLKSGKLSIKPMPTTMFNQLYRDVVCSCVLRTARELCALLPIGMVIVNAAECFVNTETVYVGDMVILSVAIPKEALESLDFGTIDPSDSILNFVHRMKFRKTSGFSPVGALVPTNFKDL